MKNFEPYELEVSVGEHNIRARTGMITDVDTIFRHPKYEYLLIGSGYDVAMLRLTKTIPLALYPPVCLPNKNESTTFEGRTATAAGWGMIKNEKIQFNWIKFGFPADESYVPSEPREVKMQVARSASCPSSVTESPSFLCASMDNLSKSGCKVLLNHSQRNLIHFLNHKAHLFTINIFRETAGAH